MKKFTAFCLALVITSAYSSTAFAADLYYPACSYDGEGMCTFEAYIPQVLSRMQL